MPPLPKRKYPKSRQEKRRSHLGLRVSQLTECSQCHTMRRPHHPCPVCGNYRGRDAIKVEGPALPE